MNVVAEGIESSDTVRLLRAHRIEYAQGYVYARPAPAAEVVGGDRLAAFGAETA
jgi:EAL domain-containing protein (putative c-di-GMP-specific phosphodiesterase class I)